MFSKTKIAACILLWEKNVLMHKNAPLYGNFAANLPTFDPLQSCERSACAKSHSFGTILIKKRNVAFIPSIGIFFAAFEPLY